MPLGTAGVSVKNLPSEPYVIDDAQWKDTAKKNVQPVHTSLTSGAFTGQAMPFSLPQSGIVGELLITLDATLTVTTAAAVTGDRWPYGLMNGFTLGINGQQNLFGDIFGEDLRIRQDIAFPAFSEQVDVFPGTIGGGNSLATGTYPIHVSWRVPVATELITLTGGIYAQSPSTTVRVNISPSLPAAMFTAATLANAALTNALWTVTETFFEPAYDSQGRIIVPSGIGAMHSMTGTDLGITATGSSPLPLVRGSGNLQRLFLSFRASPILRLSAAPNAASSILLDSLTLSYGQTQQPYIWNPASVLLQKNNLDYGFTAPYDCLIVDTLKEDPTRDAIVYAGLTELKILAGVDPGVTLAGGTCHLVQEDVFQ
jgi:hypothetical protein